MTDEKQEKNLKKASQVVLLIANVRNIPTSTTAACGICGWPYREKGNPGLINAWHTTTDILESGLN